MRAWRTKDGACCQAAALATLKSDGGFFGKAVAHSFGIDVKMTALISGLEDQANSVGLPPRKLAAAAWMALAQDAQTNHVFFHWMADVLTGKVVDGELQHLVFAPEEDAEAQVVLATAITYFEERSSYKRAPYLPNLQKALRTYYPDFPNNLERGTLLDIAFWGVNMLLGKDRHHAYVCKSIVDTVVTCCTSHDDKAAYLALEGHLLKLLAASRARRKGKIVH